MKRLTWLLISLLIICLQSSALTLDSCIAMAREHYPTIARYGLIERTANIDLDNINRTWWPQVGVYAQGTLQNDVPGFPDEMQPMLSATGLDLPGITRAQYKVGVDVNQTIWDGGTSAADRDVARADARAQTAATDVELYAVEERVQQVFFAVLLTEAQVKQNELTLNLLENNLARLRTYLANGIAMQCDVDVVEAEYLTVKQNTVRLRGRVDSYRRLLEIYIGQPLAGSELECPAAEMPSSRENLRPELAQFAAEQWRVNVRRRQLDALQMPKLSLFAQAYYGYPGYDYFHSMTSRTPTFNAMAGVKISWTITPLYTTGNRRAQLDLQADEVAMRREEFEFNSSLTEAQQTSEVAQLQQIVSDDAQIVALRTSVREAAEVRLANGVIDTTDLLARITDEATAAVNAAYHQIQLVQTIYQLRHTLNQ
ncbi:MAG: TolC family protein [Muribaculaceae bacterium]